MRKQVCNVSRNGEEGRKVTCGQKSPVSNNITFLHKSEGCEVGPAPISYQPALTPILILASPVIMGESISTLGLPWWLSGKESTCQCRRHGLDPWVKKIPWRRKWQPTPVFLPGNSMDRGARWAHGVHGVAKESDTTEQLKNNNNLHPYSG